MLVDTEKNIIPKSQGLGLFLLVLMAPRMPRLGPLLLEREFPMCGLSLYLSTHLSLTMEKREEMNT